MRKKIWIQRAVKILCLLLCVLLLSSIAMDFCRYYDYNVYKMVSFYKEPKNSLDVVLVGASEVFTGFSSGYAYDLYGFTSYPYALDAMPCVLYKSQVKEVLANQNPKWIVIEINGAMYETPDAQADGGVLRRYLNNIPLNWNKISTITELIPVEEWYFHFFSLAKYHGNWKDALNQCNNIQDYYYLKWNHSVLKGNVTVISPFDAPVPYDFVDDYSKHPLEPVAEKYLREFLDYCKSNGIHNIIFTRFPHVIAADWSCTRFQRGNEAARIITEEYGFPFIDLEREASQMGLDYATDFYNEDHLTYTGQIKLTEYLGKILVEEYGVGKSNLTQEQRLNWESAAEYTRLFYQYCADVRASGEIVALYEIPSIISQLDSIKNGM